MQFHSIECKNQCNFIEIVFPKKIQSLIWNLIKRFSRNMKSKENMWKQSFPIKVLLNLVVASGLQASPGNILNSINQKPYHKYHITLIENAFNMNAILTTFALISAYTSTSTSSSSIWSFSHFQRNQLKIKIICATKTMHFVKVFFFVVFYWLHRICMHDCMELTREVASEFN